MQEQKFFCQLCSRSIFMPYRSEGRWQRGRIKLGTIQGEIHDLSKNLFAILLKCHGIEVIDFGVDVSVHLFFTKPTNPRRFILRHRVDLSIPRARAVRARLPLCLSSAAAMVSRSC